MRHDGKAYYCVKMTYSKGYERYIDVDTLDEALLRVKKEREFDLCFDTVTLENAVIWKIKPEKVYEFKKNAE